MKKIICILLCTFALVSCDYKVHLRECSFEERDANTLFVFWNNKPYNGELWSDDESSMCLICEKGLVKSMIMYHVNGKTAATIETTNPEPICFDINGNRISAEEFEKNYADKYMFIMEYELGPKILRPTNSRNNMEIDSLANALDSATSTDY